MADPALAQAAGNSLTRVAHKTSSGIDINAYVALPKQTPAPCVLLVHEWWGLNDQIKSVAAEFANQGYVALAVDLYQGKVASSRADAKAYMQSTDRNWQPKR